MCNMNKQLENKKNQFVIETYMSISVLIHPGLICFSYI